jgi:hypothetical protein
MTPTEYQQLVLQTCGTTDKCDMIVTAALAFAGESAEILESYRKRGQLSLDEIGDILWYITTFTTAIDYSIDSLFISPPLSFAVSSQDGEQALELIIKLMCLAGNIADHIKKWQFHGHTLNTSLMYLCLYAMISLLTELCKQIPKSETFFVRKTCTLEDAMIQNIEKLKRRYPDGFSSKRSIYREQEQENGSDT